MRRVLVYEHLTATIANPDPADSLFREGRAMRDAVVRDLSAIPGVDGVLTPGLVGWVKPGFAGADPPNPRRAIAGRWVGARRLT
jgi:hypothetical protein